jgi:hypothetical protein
MNEILDKNAIIFTDWAASVKHTDLDLNSFIYEILIYSLLYDEVLIQDEVFALSNKIASWMNDERERGLLEKIFEIGTLKILSFPKESYPLDLQEAAYTNPIQTRSKYLQKFATSHEDQFIASEKQNSLYNFIDSSVSRNRSLLRPIRKSQQLNLLGVFHKLLVEVLTKPCYEKWINTAFKNIQAQTKDEFVGYILKPESAIKKLSDNNISPRNAIDKNNEPMFTRSLGYQISKLYNYKEAIEIQCLLQTTFAAPFCYNENGVGRYSSVLRELPLLDSGSYCDAETKAVSVVQQVDIPINLPSLDVNFIDAIQNVRESSSCKNLRDSIQSMGNDLNFDRQIEYWNDVSDQLASNILSCKKTNLKVATIDIGGSLFTGAVLNYFINGGQKSIFTTDNLEAALIEILSGSLLVSGKHFIELVKYDLRRQELREKLERSVQFRCSPIAISSEFWNEI